MKLLAPPLSRRAMMAGVGLQAQAKPRSGTGARPRALALIDDRYQKRSIRWLLRDL